MGETKSKRNSVVVICLVSDPKVRCCHKQRNQLTFDFHVGQVNVIVGLELGLDLLELLLEFGHYFSVQLFVLPLELLQNFV